MHSANKPQSSTTILSSPQKNSLPRIKEAIKENLAKKDKDSRRSKAVHREHRETSGIPRNINYYRHLINDHDSTQDGVEWVLKLRSTRTSTSMNKMEATSTQPFSFADKPLEGQAHRRQITDLDARNSLHQLTHLLYHRMGPSPTRGSLQFESGLRSYGSISIDMMSREKAWRNIPKKDKPQGDTTMYPSYDEMRGIKSWTTKNTGIKMHPAYDGHLSFPKYDELCKSADKNLAETGHLLTAPGQHMPLVHWQLSMRNYGSPLKRATSVDKPASSVNSVGEAKKVKRPQRV